MGNSIESQAMLLFYDIRILLPMLLPDLAQTPLASEDGSTADLTKDSPCGPPNLSSPFSEFDTAATDHGFPNKSSPLFCSLNLDCFFLLK